MAHVWNKCLWFGTKNCSHLNWVLLSPLMNILPNLPLKKANSTQWPMFRSAREHMHTCAFILIFYIFLIYFHVIRSEIDQWFYRRCNQSYLPLCTKLIQLYWFIPLVSLAGALRSHLPLCIHQTGRCKISNSIFFWHPQGQSHKVLALCTSQSQVLFWLLNCWTVNAEYLLCRVLTWKEYLI